jgi:metal-responsive CopG/Arc/MetJ family transcriptional regulator
MKTAVSIPDALYRQADREARRCGLSRSRLYAQALQDYLTKTSDAAITTKLNEIYRDEDSRLPPDLAAIAHRRLREAEW